MLKELEVQKFNHLISNRYRHFSRLNAKLFEDVMAIAAQITPVNYDRSLDQLKALNFKVSSDAVQFIVKVLQEIGISNEGNADCVAKTFVEF